MRVYVVGYPRDYLGTMITPARPIERRCNISIVRTTNMSAAHFVSVSIYGIQPAAVLAKLMEARTRGLMTMWTTYENVDVPDMGYSHYSSHYLSLTDLSTGFRRMSAPNYARLPNWLLRLEMMKEPCTFPQEWSQPGWPPPDEWARRPHGTAYVARHGRYPRMLLANLFKSPSALTAIGRFSAPSNSLRNMPWPMVNAPGPDVVPSAAAFPPTDGRQSTLKELGSAPSPTLVPGGPARPYAMPKMDFLRQHRFVITPENSWASGYVTEKLIEAHLSGAVPLYWGGEAPPEPRIFNTRRILALSREQRLNGQEANHLLRKATLLATNVTSRDVFFSHPILLPTAQEELMRMCDAYVDGFLKGWARSLLRHTRGARHGASAPTAAAASSAGSTATAQQGGG